MKTNSNKKILHLFGGGILAIIAEEIARGEGWHVILRTGARLIDPLCSFSQETDIYVGDDVIELLQQGDQPTKGDIGLSITAPWIIPQSVIDMFSGDIFNIHGQPLPRFRGGGGVSWMIMMGERSGGCCIHRLVNRIDAGDIYARRHFEFTKACFYPQDYMRMIIDESTLMLKEWLPQLLRTGDPGEELLMNEQDSEYWPRLNTEIHGWIDWSWSLYEINDFCCAFSHPYEGAKTNLRGGVIRLKKVSFISEPNKFHSFQNGMIYRIDNDVLNISHKDGTLLVEEYSVDNSIDKIILGDRLRTSKKTLSEALNTRIQYTASGVVVDN